jgi:hypothetical protein
MLSILLVIVLASPVSAQPVNLDVHDAPAREVISGLAALHGLTLVVERPAEEAMSRRITLRLENADFGRSLQSIGAAAGVDLRIEGSRLIASLAHEVPPAAPEISERFRDWPRIAAEEHADRDVTRTHFDYKRRPFSMPDLNVRVQRGREETCRRVRVKPAGTAVTDIGDFRLVQLAYDRASRTRYLVLDPPEGEARVVRLSPSDGEMAFDFGAASSAITVTLSETADPTCSVVEAGPGGNVVHSKEGKAPEYPVIARVQLVAQSPDARSKAEGGWCVFGSPGETFGGGSAVTNMMRREPREWAFQSYIPRHGGAPIAVVEIGVTLTDARDHREYYYAQFAASEKAVPLRREGTVAAEVPEGPASAEPLELWVYAEEDRWVCSGRASKQARRE